MATSTFAQNGLLGLTILNSDADDSRVWTLSAAAPRVPPREDELDKGNTPGVHAMRTLWLRDNDRRLSVSTHARVAYADPALEDVCISVGQNNAVEVRIENMSHRARISGEHRVLVGALNPHPPSEASGIRVPFYVLREGSVELAGHALSKAFTKDNITMHGSAWLEREGIAFVAEVPRPDTPLSPASRIPTHVRLSRTAGEYAIELIPERQSPQSEQRWRETWTSLRGIHAASQQTAWLRADFVVGDTLPALKWPVKVSQGKLKVDWSSTQLPAGLVRLWLSDQPLESQALPPERVLELIPDRPVLRADGSKLLLGSMVPPTPTVTAATTPATSSAASSASTSVPGPGSVRYTWGITQERIALAATEPLVHAPNELLKQLRDVYDDAASTAEAPQFGFMPERRGWVVLPFAPETDQFKVPARRIVAPSAVALGSLRLGLRRHDLRKTRDEAREAGEAPWSLQVDAPADFVFSIDFSQHAKTYTLDAASITMFDCALRCIGMLWLAARKPDADDALPRADADANAFMPLTLWNCNASEASQAPFLLQNFVVRAPARAPYGDWDAPALRWSRSPSLEPTVSMLTRIHSLHPAPSPLRAWFRHPRLPTIQLMPLSRSNLQSTAPHASRGLEPFVSNASVLTLNAPQSFSPYVSGPERQRFAPEHATSPLPLAAVLTMPGITTRARDATTYDYDGWYTLPTCIEPEARAGLPVSDETSAPPAPLITARDPQTLVDMARARMRMAQLAWAQDAVMFEGAAANTASPVTAQGLAPPLTWPAEVTVSDTVDLKTWTLGRIDLRDTSGWHWPASADALLSGPDTQADVSQPGVVTLGGGGQIPLNGWALADHEDAGVVRDGRGLSGDTTLQATSVLAWRRVTAGEHIGELCTSVQALSIQGAGFADWHFAFTDLYVEAGQYRFVASRHEGGAAALDACWTWTLYTTAGGDPASSALPLGAMFRFTPASLIEVSFDKQDRRVTRCVIEGALGLGIAARPLANDARQRARLTFVADGQHSLRFEAVEKTPLTQKGLEWTLRSTLHRFSTTPACLHGFPILGAGGWTIDRPQLIMQWFGAQVTVDLEATSETVLTLAPNQSSVKPFTGDISLGACQVDLANATLSYIAVHVHLRAGVMLALTDECGARAPAPAVLNWFGNPISFNTVYTDTVSRAVTLGEPAAQELIVMPQGRPAKLDSGSLAFTFEIGPGETFALQTLFFELIARAAPSLTVSHLLHKARTDHTPHDALRFDGALTIPSAIGWPDIDPPPIGSANSAIVQFGQRPAVRHVATLQLCDHRIDGSQLEPQSGAGIRLVGTPESEPGATWIVQMRHRLCWSDPLTQDFAAVAAVQLWSASTLARALRALGRKFSFTASYRHPDQRVPDFPDPGVRRISVGMAGLFGMPVVQALENLGDTWVIVGSGSFLVPDEQAQDTHLHVHLPMIAPLEDANAAQQPPAQQTLGDALRQALSVNPAVLALRMSRHDLLQLPVILPPDTAHTLGSLSRPLPETVSFTIDYAGAQGTPGAPLARGFLRHRGAPLQACWHVEQFQPPGPSNKLPTLPFAFPRAAVMLRALRDKSILNSTPVLSILVAFSAPGDSQPRSIVCTVRAEPPVPKPAPVDFHAQADLVVGTTDGLHRIPVDSGATLINAGASRVLQALLGTVAAPKFAVLRMFDEVPRLVALRVPPAKRFIIGAPPSALRDASGLAHVDGQLTWPEQFGNAPKSQHHVVLDKRAHTPVTNALSIAMHGALRSARLAGGEFQAAFEEPVPTLHTEPVSHRQHAATTWLQHSEEVAFDAIEADAQDALPVATPGARTAHPMVPSICALSHALGRAEPSLAAPSFNVASTQTVPRLQTYLPPVLHDFDLSDRAGAFSLVRVRTLWAGTQAASDQRAGDPALCAQGARASAGVTSVRWSRVPRPQALPPNAGDWWAWRRTVSWYGQPKSSCLVLRGRWRAFFGMPADNGVPAWGLLVGQPEAHAAFPPECDPVWHGAVRLRCLSLGGTAQDGASQLLALLNAHPESARAGLRCDQTWIPFVKVAVQTNISGETVLLFSPATGSAALNGASDCVFELSLDVQHALPQPYPLGSTAPLAVRAVKLDPITVHSVGINVTPPSTRDFPLPLITRTILFEDPEYDALLSALDPVTASGRTGDAQAPEFQLWIDRASVTPGETLAMCASRMSLSLSAAVKRQHGAGLEALRFRFEPFANDVLLDKDTLVSLPLSLLDNDAGPLRPGDLLRLQATPSATGATPATLFIAVKAQSALPAPEAMYSLLACADDPDAGHPRAWCALHSPNPAADTLACFPGMPLQRGRAATPAGQSPARLVRRAYFQWETTESSRLSPAFAVMKTHLPSESTHVPREWETELMIPAAHNGPSC